MTNSFFPHLPLTQRSLFTLTDCFVAFRFSSSVTVQQHAAGSSSTTIFSTMSLSSRSTTSGWILSALETTV